MKRDYLEIAKKLDERFPDFFLKHGEKVLDRFYRTEFGPMFMAENFLEVYYPEVFVNYEKETLDNFMVFRFMDQFTWAFDEAWLSSKTFVDFFSYYLNKGYISNFDYIDNKKKDSFKKDEYRNIFYDGYENKLKPKEKNAMLKFLYDENRLAYLYCDFTEKTQSLYMSLISEEVLPEYNKELLNDYFKLVDSIMDGKYIINGKTISISDCAKYDSENPFIFMDGGDYWDVSTVGEHIGKIFFLMFSSNALFIAYCYWLNTKDESSLKKFLIILAVRIKMLTESYDFGLFGDKIKDINQLIDTFELKCFREKNAHELIGYVINTTEEYHNNTNLLIKQKEEEINKFIKDTDDEIVKKYVKDDFKSNSFNLEYIAQEKFDYLFGKCSSTHIIIDCNNKYLTNECLENSCSESMFSNFISDLRRLSVKYDLKSFFKENECIKELNLENGKEEVPKNTWMYKLAKNMDFKPYIKMIKRLDFRSAYGSKLGVCSSELCNLGLCLESIYLLSFILQRMDGYADDQFKIEFLIMNIKKFVYGNQNARYVKNELEKLSENSLFNNIKSNEANIQKRFFVLIDQLLDEFNDSNNIEYLLTKKQEILDEMLRFGIDEQTLAISEKIANRIVDKFVALESKNSDFVSIKLKVSTKLKGLIEKIRNYNNKLSLYSQEEFEIEMGKIVSYIATGEMLYDSFTKNNTNKDIDYGCMALVYYKALEALSNFIFYKPYYDEVLSKRHNLEKENESGYCGYSFDKITKREKGSREYRNSLEYGTISYLYSKMNESKDYIHMFNFYKEKGMNIEKINNFFDIMNKTAYLRNNCAHPKISNFDSLEIARKKVYDCSSAECNNELYELIFEIENILD